MSVEPRGRDLRATLQPRSAVGVAQAVAPVQTLVSAVCSYGLKAEQRRAAALPLPGIPSKSLIFWASPRGGTDVRSASL